MKLETKFLLVPILAIFILISIAYYFGFLYTAQLVIASGAIMSAFISMYLVKANRLNDEINRHKDRATKLEYVMNLGKQSVSAVESEIKGYKEFHKSLQGVELWQEPFPDNSFHFLNQFINYNQGDFYSNIVQEYSDKEDEAVSEYLTLSSSIQSSIDIKNNSQKEYTRFMEFYNQKSKVWVQNQYALNDIYMSIKGNSTGNQVFDNTFFKIVDEFNLGVQNREIDPNNFDHIRNEYLYKLNGLLNHHYFPEGRVFRMQQIVKQIEVSLNKMQQVQVELANHIQNNTDNLSIELNKTIRALKFFGYYDLDNKIEDGLILEPLKEEAKVNDPVELRK